MIVCKLIGGLGNQMFQYAYAEALAQYLQDDICFDNSYYEGKEPAIFKFDIKYRDAEMNVEKSDFTIAKKKEKLYHVLEYVIRKLNHEEIGQKLFHWYSKQGYYFNFDPFYYPSIKTKKQNKFIYGYFQGLQYFKSVEENIKKEFTADLSECAKKYERQIEDCEAVAIHIRLGDYQNRKNQYLNVCTDVYYEKGIKYINEHVNNPFFFVFTNNEKEVRSKKYIPSEAVFITGTKDYEDILLMKKCKHFVISASTFSWWGSYLSEYEEKITVIPEIWMTTLKKDSAITMRDDMVKIEVK